MGQLTSTRHKISMIRAIMVSGKHGIEALMLALKDAEIKSEAIPVHMYQWKTAAQQTKYKFETLTVMLHSGNINETTKICLPKYKEWRKATSEDNALRYI